MSTLYDKLLFEELLSIISLNMKLYLLSPEIYVQATASLSGPPAELFTAYVGMRDTIGFVITPWLRDQVAKQLEAGGFDKEKAVEQAEFIASLGHAADDPKDLGDEPLIAIAKSLKLKEVYHASGKEGTVDGVTYKPVGELHAKLTS